MTTRGASGQSTRRRVVRRWIARIVVFLLLGVVVNVAVAWGCVLWSSDLQSIDSSELYWPIRPPVGYVRPTESNYDGHKRFGATKLGAWVLTDSGHSGRLELLLAGWPERSLYSERHYMKEIAGIPALTRFDEPADFWEGIAIPSWMAKFRIFDCFPTRALWPGFAINTLFYAAILWLVFGAPLALRRWRRVRKGLCPKCAYPMGESDVCTECGSVVKRHNEPRP